MQCSWANFGKGKDFFEQALWRLEVASRQIALTNLPPRIRQACGWFALRLDLSRVRYPDLSLYPDWGTWCVSACSGSGWQHSVGMYPDMSKREGTDCGLDLLSHKVERDSRAWSQLEGFSRHKTDQCSQSGNYGQRLSTIDCLALYLGLDCQQGLFFMTRCCWCVHNIFSAPISYNRQVIEWIPVQRPIRPNARFLVGRQQ